MLGDGRRPELVRLRGWRRTSVLLVCALTAIGLLGALILLRILGSVPVSSKSANAAKTANTASATQGDPLLKQPSDYPTVAPLEWESPSPEWALILDPWQFQVVMFDPISRKIRGRLQVGAYPDAVVSPDGEFLYVASQVPTPNGGRTDELSVIEIESGRLLHSVGTRGRLQQLGSAPQSGLTFSSDGRWLYWLRSINSLTTYDVAAGTLLEQDAEIGDCGLGTILNSSRNLEAHVLCPGTSQIAGQRRKYAIDVRFVELKEDGAAHSIDRVELLAKPEIPAMARRDAWRPAGGAATRDRSQIFALTQNGWLSTIDVTSRKLTASRRLELSPEEVVSRGVPVVSGDQNSIWAGIVDLQMQVVGEQPRANRIGRFSLTTGTTEEEIVAEDPLISLAPDERVRQILGIPAEAGALQLFDTVRGRRAYGVRELLKKPTFAQFIGQSLGS